MDWRDWQDAVLASRLHAKAQAANRLAGRAIAAFSQLDGVRRLLDIGGGDGTLARAFLEFYPGLHVTLLDFAGCARMARRQLRRGGFSHRVQVRSQDLFSGDMGSDYDACLVSRLMRFFTPQENLRMLRKAFHVLRPQGRLILHDGFTPAETGVSEDRWHVWSVGQVRSWVKKAGFDGCREAIPAQLILARKQ